ncbi:MAG: endonuclease [Alphaproteobacteria bacterium]|nr:endonuclease [Alphaproteobacteria bacterium]
MFVRQWTFVITIAFAIGVGVGAQLPTRTVAPPASAPISIEAFFTPGTECEDRIIAEINRATTVDIAVYSITNSKIANAIIAAHQRGARVRIITDRTMAGHKSSRIDELVAAGIPVRVNHRHKIEHNKFAVFDNRRMVTGSYNWTSAATKYNSENCIFMPHPAQEYTKRFEYLWNAYKK